ncbi:MAG: hypothetical protein M0026_10770 [Nocardiopsaceae bacterium]|nr:hypothetical protein [Nocardiopsaceae bacterium]
MRAGQPEALAVLAWASLRGLITLGLSGHLVRKGIDSDAESARLVGEVVTGLRS